MAREGPTDAESPVSTRVMGTYGYAAPEYIATGTYVSHNAVRLRFHLMGISMNRPFDCQERCVWNGSDVAGNALWAEGDGREADGQRAVGGIRGALRVGSPEVGWPHGPETGGAVSGEGGSLGGPTGQELHCSRS
ncbi:hypothetical protein B296_00052708 [Ensete ventricosum]|uniref:Protein kinase domain-containing protein n=1 Tax=Ensete ventricosum TaxID=4639 RepID=A0A426Y993_ENSVE|nr:hypothetical protein B296_00052708 [Ensete ventricosum]